MDGGWFATHADNGPVFIKKFKKGETNNAKREMELYSVFGDKTHRNVGLPYEHIFYSDCYYTMQEKLDGGDLFDHIIRMNETKPYSLEEVRQLALWLLEGTRFLHSHGICYRDLKPENIMGGVRSGMEGEGGFLKLVDFGTGKHFPELQQDMDKHPEKADELLKEFTEQLPTKGEAMYSKNYSSPEFKAAQDLQKKYNPFAADVWSIGQTLYAISTGMAVSETTSAIKKQLESGRATYLETGFKKLILAMTAPQADRCTVKQALENPWLQTESNHQALPDSVVQGLLQMGQTTRLVVNKGDYFVREVGTEGTHQIEGKRMGDFYCLDKAVAVDNIQRDTYMKEQLPNYKYAQAAGMAFYPSKEVRKLVVFNKSGLAKIIEGISKDVKYTWSSGGELQVTNPESIPSNRATFDFVKTRIDAGDPDFKVQDFKKKGVFGKVMTENKKMEMAHTESVPDTENPVLVYTSPWAKEAAFQFLKLQAGDALVYREEKEGVSARVHTMEKVAVEKNFDAGFTKKYQVNETIEADWDEDGVWYDGKIIKVDAAAEIYRIRYTADRAEEDCKEWQMRTVKNIRKVGTEGDKNAHSPCSCNMM